MFFWDFSGRKSSNVKGFSNPNRQTQWHAEGGFFLNVPGAFELPHPPFFDLKPKPADLCARATGGDRDDDLTESGE
jgi:hypothetical protein